MGTKSFNFKEIMRFKGLIVLIALAICFNLLISSKASAADDENTAIMLNSVYEEKSGKNVALNVYLSNPAKMASGIIELQYDAELVKAISIEKGQLLTDFKFTPNLDNAKEGKVKVAFASTKGVEDSGILFTVKFRTMKAVEDAPIKISYAKLYSEDLNEIPAKKVDGRIGKFKGVEKNPIKSSDVKKNIRIEFNLPVDKSTVNDCSIKIENSSGESVPVKFSFEKGNKVIVISPTLEYLKGQYTLTVSEQILSTSGKKLKLPAKVQFIIE